MHVGCRDVQPRVRRELPLLVESVAAAWLPKPAPGTPEVLSGKENRLQLCGANMQTSTVKGGRIISADGS